VSPEPEQHYFRHRYQLLSSVISQNARGAVAQCDTGDKVGQPLLGSRQMIIGRKGRGNVAAVVWNLN
jgi:hypothetical protein